MLAILSPPWHSSSMARRESGHAPTGTAVLFCTRKPFINEMLAARSGPLRILVHQPVSLLAENHHEGYKMTWTFGDRFGKVDFLPGGLHAG